RRVALWLITKH
ncbi:D-isomer specific 2-hydroxyacid dehydrogenase, catalytic domain protein, partial [Vibrio parahaemolyticus AQ3810]